jgi:imidazolonepropionase-like amidohydrolase
MQQRSRALTVLAGATVLWGERLDAIDADVVVAGELIDRLAPRSSPADRGAEILDCTGLTLLPGFLDAHVHIGFFSPREVLAGGVTTARDLAWPPEEIFELVARSAAPGFAGPQVFAAGQMLTAPGGYPTRARWAPPGTGREVKSPAEAAEAVAEQAERGACVVKIALNPPAGPVLDAETLAAVVDEAHRRGLRVTGHVHGLDQLRKALDCGVDELAHMLMGPDRIPEHLADAMVASDMSVVPTLSCRLDDMDDGVADLARFLDAGGTVVYGTDLGNEGPRPGIEAREIDAMGRAGMTGKEIIASATTVAACRLGLRDRGAIEPSLRADIIGVRGDPRSDPRRLAEVALVMRAGMIR